VQHKSSFLLPTFPALIHSLSLTTKLW